MGNKNPLPVYPHFVGSFLVAPLFFFGVDRAKGKALLLSYNYHYVK